MLTQEVDPRKSRIQESTNRGAGARHRQMNWETTFFSHTVIAKSIEWNEEVFSMATKTTVSRYNPEVCNGLPADLEIKVNGNYSHLNKLNRD